jgi:hypothetical protein
MSGDEIAEMYLSLLESFAVWLEARGSSRKDALFRAGVAFSLYALIALVSLIALLTVLGRVPAAGWISTHSWSIWVAAAVIAVVHWRLTLKLGRRGQTGEGILGPRKPSPRLWYWYFLPVLALLIATAMIAIANSTN